jgi:hypothetical protein
VLATANFAELTVELLIETFRIAVVVLICFFVGFLDEEMSSAGGPELAKELQHAEAGGDKEDATALTGFETAARPPGDAGEDIAANGNREQEGGKQDYEQAPGLQGGKGHGSTFESRV